jgi:hypothetical protein
MLDPAVKDTLGLVETTPGKQQFDHALSIAGWGSYVFMSEIG